MGLSIITLFLVGIGLIWLYRTGQKEQREKIIGEKKAKEWYISEVREDSKKLKIEEFASKYENVYTHIESNRNDIDEALFHNQLYRNKFLKYIRVKDEKRKLDAKKEQIRRKEALNKEKERKKEIEKAIENLKSLNDLDDWRDDKSDYTKLYNHPKWLKFRKYALKYYGEYCRECGSSENLQVHHKEYKGGAPWHYKLEDLEIICRKCHWKIHN